ncbi:uncharacterized protein LOC123876787 [Maniola jurtina]|uniref:uncharacterized protein LOC123876787 n=1 Tax=Maniola jurtina TaxID=191418 RepID=UPI001E68762C|nr:uncharacterized protein LOC123876787 [Maniola jurtina]
MAVYVSHMTRIMMFELLWNRMRVLRKTMESKLDFSPTMFDREVNHHILELEKYVNVYKMQLDNVKKIGHASKLLIFLSLPSYFVYVFTIVLEKLVSKGDQYDLDIMYIADCMINVILPLVPALFAELVTAEVDKIRIHLTRQLLFCSNNALRNRTYDALKFLKLRPFKYTIWRAFSLNISLPLGLISLCTTYTIVMVQFSHVYG